MKYFSRRRRRSDRLRLHAEIANVRVSASPTKPCIEHFSSVPVGSFSSLESRPWGTMAKVGALVLVTLLMSFHCHAHAEVGEKLPPPPSPSCENAGGATAGTSFDGWGSYCEMQCTYICMGKVD